MVLTYDAYSETLGNQKEKEDRLTVMEKDFSSMKSMLENLLSGLSKTTNQQEFNNTTKSLFSSGVLKVPSDMKEN